jgi:hypothetical protein
MCNPQNHQNFRVMVEEYSGHLPLKQTRIMPSFRQIPDKHAATPQLVITI